MNKLARRLLFSALILTTGCGGLRWYGSSRDLGPDAAYPKKEAGPRFYSDLGPDSVDVSGYPEEQRHNYAVYSRACSQCHTLARSINSPTVDRDSWNFYVTSMHIQTYFRSDARLSENDMKDILDFLVYDSKVRKIDRAADFRQLSAELQLRYSRMVLEKLEKN